MKRSIVLLIAAAISVTVITIAWAMAWGAYIIFNNQ